ncbi:MAG: AMIN domain-containing protein, partial [Gammaproteobacteria bacterium]
MDWCSKRDCLRWTRAVSARVLLWMTLSVAPAMAAVQPLGAIDFSPATTQSPATVVMSIPERPEFKVFALDGPPRLVVDLAGTRLGNGIDPLGLATLADAAPLRGIRIAPRGDSLRVVIDLAQPQAHRVQWRAAKGGAKPRLEVLLGLPRANRTVAVVESPRGPAPTVASEPKAVAAVPDGIASPSAGTASPVLPGSPVSAGTTVASEPPVVRAAPVAVEAVPSPVAPVRNKVPTGGRDLVVAIDAGHWGKDPGAVGAKGTREKDVTLAIARRLAAVIDAE